MLTAPLLWIGHGQLAATTVSTGSLIVSALVMWRPSPGAGGSPRPPGFPSSPPLPLMLTAPLLWIGHGQLAATTVSPGSLIVSAIVMWRLLPVPWRSAAPLVCLGLGLLPAYARLGYPAIVACALLI